MICKIGQLFSEFINRQDQNGQLQKYLECPEILSGSLLEEKEAPVYKRTVYKSKIDDFKDRSSNGDANRFFSMEHGFLEN